MKSHPRLQTFSGTRIDTVDSSGQSSTCPLCSNRFDMTSNCHDGCPLSNGCSLVRCPNCGYEFPDPGRSRLASLLQRWFGNKKQTAGESP